MKEMFNFFIFLDFFFWNFMMKMRKFVGFSDEEEESK